MLSVALSLCLLFAAVCGQTGLSGADKQELLEVHNYFRSKVNPIATNMEMMVRLLCACSQHKFACYDLKL